MYHNQLTVSVIVLMHLVLISLICHLLKREQEQRYMKMVHKKKKLTIIQKINSQRMNYQLHANRWTGMAFFVYGLIYNCIGYSFAVHFQLFTK